MHCSIDEQNRNLVPVAFVEGGVVEDRQLLEGDGCLGPELREHGADDIPSGLAQVAIRLSDEGERGHDPRLNRMPDDAAPQTGDRPILAFFDVDNTLMRGASVYYVGREAFRRGLISWRDIAVFGWHQFRFLAVGENRSHLSTAKDRALGLVGGFTEDSLTRLANDIWEKDIAPKLWPETVALTRDHLARGHEVWLITATPQLVAQVIADRLGLTGALGTRVQALDGVFTGSLDGPVLHGIEKSLVAGDFARERSAELADCWAYSDSSHDIPLLSLVGHRVVVNPDARLLAHARAEKWTILPLTRSGVRQERRNAKREARALRRTA